MHINNVKIRLKLKVCIRISQACDIYIAKFLSDIKIGTPPFDQVEIFNAPKNDELQIYNFLLEQGKNSDSEKAAAWFINHYPLLGGLAAGFKIIEDQTFCWHNEIRVAAVDVTKAEIYVNPAADLDSEELKFVLAHEFLHAGLQHHERWQCLGTLS